MAIQRNITDEDEWFIGEDKTLTVTIYQSDETTPQNVTGWAVSFMLKRKRTDTDANALITKTTADDVALTTPGSGVITVSIADDDTSDLRADTYWYEIKRTDAGFETVLTYGSVELLQAVHR